MGCGNSANTKFMLAFEKASTAKAIELENLNLDMNTFSEFLQKVSTNSNATSFKLKNITVTGKFNKLPFIKKSLRVATKLTSFELNGLSNLGDKKGKSLYAILRDKPDIERLVLQDMHLEDEDAEFLAALIKEFCKKLKYLDLTGNYFGKNTELIFKALSNNVCIQTAIFMNMSIDSDLAEKLSNSMENNKDLETLDISNNPIKNGTSNMRNLFYFNGRMKSLIMNNCGIDDDSFSLLLEFLEEDKCLKQLYLNNNDITEFSVENIAKMFSRNQSLEYLYLLKNKIYKRDISAGLGSRDFEKVVVDL